MGVKMEYKVKCIPYMKESFEIVFFDEVQAFTQTDLFSDNYSSKCIFSNLTHEFLLSEAYCENIVANQTQFFVNEVEEPCMYRDGVISFPKSNNKDNIIFCECYGFTELKIVLFYSDEKEQLVLYSMPIPVMIKESEINYAIKAMATYIFEQEESLLKNGNKKPKNLSGLKEHDEHTLEAQIALAQDIWSCYEQNFDYFRVNCRFRIKEVDIIDSLEKLEYVTPQTVQYIVQHPEYLKKAHGAYGVLYQNQVYHPEKTLISQNTYSRDTYENRIVVNFLQTIIVQLENLFNKIGELTSQSVDTKVNGYISSYATMVEVAIVYLKSNEAKIKKLLDYFQSLLLGYLDIMQFKIDDLDCIYTTPEPSAILLSVPQYNKVYTLIYQWFHFDLYDFGTEKYLLSMLKSSDLYENYLVAKYIHYFRETGWTLIEKSAYQYPLISTQGGYFENNCNNTFKFQKKNKSITFYYQPVLYSNCNLFHNDLEIYRNTSILFNDSGEKNRARYAPKENFYNPDFVFKIDYGEKKAYIIADAKFSTIKTVKIHHVPSLSFKYLFSLATASKNEKILGLVILYGKCMKENRLESAYNKKPTGVEIEPFAELVPLMESINNESHFDYISKVLKIDDFE